jgi:hypothetical protein
LPDIVDHTVRQSACARLRILAVEDESQLEQALVGQTAILGAVVAGADLSQGGIGGFLGRRRVDLPGSATFRFGWGLGIGMAGAV